MNTETGATMRVACPHCGTTNRVVRDRLADGPSCGACRKPLLEGKPVSLTGEQFDRHVRNSDMPLVVDFWAAWCGPCRAMAPVFERVAGDFANAAQFVKINTDEEQALATRLGIRSIPTLGIFKDGKEVARTAGAMDATRFVSFLRQHI